VSARLATLGLALPPLIFNLFPVLAPAVYDLIPLRRLHRATILVALLLAITFVFAGALIFGNAGTRLIDHGR
jgi:hypothetical protein